MEARTWWGLARAFARGRCRDRVSVGEIARAQRHARDAFQKVRPDENAAADLAAVEASLADHKASWHEVFARRWRKPLIVGVGLAVLQQLTGINAIIYYADKVFAAAGFRTPVDQTSATTWCIGAVNILFTFVAVLYVDRLGRRPLLLAGLVGMGISLLALGTLLGTPSDERGCHASTAYSSSAPPKEGLYSSIYPGFVPERAASLWSAMSAHRDAASAPRAPSYTAVQNSPS